MREAVITTALRTAIGNDNGALRDVPHEYYAAHVIKELVRRSGIDPEEIEDLIWGNQQGVGRIGRNTALLAGLPIRVPGIRIDRACSSGLQSIVYAVLGIAWGNGDVYVAGGAESLSRAPYHLMRPSQAYQRTPPQFITVSGEPVGDPSLGLQTPMGITAENVAEEFKISREEMDEFSLLSHQRAIRAIDEGRFKEQIVPFPVPQRRGEPIIFDTDEHPRRDTTLEVLRRLPPAFKPGGKVTAGNSCGITDAAAGVVVMARDKAKALSLEPLGVLRAYAVEGVHPNIMGVGPIPAVRKVLKRAGLKLEDMELIELNEAFASQTLAVMRELGMDLEKVNVNGGAIALGHPVGASGAILTMKLLYEMRRRDLHRGLVTMCIGGGMGMAAIFERP